MAAPELTINRPCKHQVHCPARHSALVTQLSSLGPCDSALVTQLLSQKQTAKATCGWTFCRLVALVQLYISASFPSCRVLQTLGSQLRLQNFQITSCVSEEGWTEQIELASCTS